MPKCTSRRAKTRLSNQPRKTKSKARSKSYCLKKSPTLIKKKKLSLISIKMTSPS